MADVNLDVDFGVIYQTGTGDAKQTGYDNTESGLEATNVQDAIDEVNTKIENIPSVDAYTKEEANDKFATKTALQTVAEAIPTKTSQLTNNSGFTTIDDTTATSNKTWSSEKINGIKTLLDDVTIVESGETIIDVSPFTLTEGYIGQNGNYSASTSYHYTNKIPVQKGDKIYVYKADGTTQVGSYRFVTCYHNNVAITEKGGQNVSAPFVVPDGIEEVILSISNVSAPASAKIQRGHSVKELINQPQVDALLSMSASAKPNGLEYEFDYTAGTTFQSEELFEDLCAYRFCFFAKITSITDIATIGKGLGNYYGGGIGFDDTNLYLYQGTSATPTSTKPHGLTLKDYVAITLDNKYTVEATVTISTNGGRYEWVIPTWRSNYGKLSFSASDNMTECKLSYTCEGLIKDTWLYGDSYFSNSDGKRWTKYLVASGRTNYLLNAYGGRNSASALASLKVDLKMNRVPRRIVWCLGMNDKDGDSAVNASWLSCIEEVKTICLEHHVELIMATIPNVPSTNAKNIYKNAYVEASGYRYIDFAKAVSLNGDSTWYDNMLYSDNLHPDTQGAIALYSQAVATVPELLL